MKMPAPRACECSVCGHKIAPYFSYWVDFDTDETYCCNPDKDNPAPTGPCFIAGVKKFMDRHQINGEWSDKETSKLLLTSGNGFHYYTDG